MLCLAVAEAVEKRRARKVKSKEKIQNGDKFISERNV